MRIPYPVLLFVSVVCLTGCRPAEQPSIICTGQLSGYIEPCGCTRPQLGGLSRLDRLISSIEPAPIMLDNGDLTMRVGRQAHIKWLTMIGAFGMMGYSAVNVGERDLALGVDFIKAEAAAANVPLISANITGPDGKLLFKPFVILNINGLRVAVIGLLGVDFAENLPVKLIDPAEAVERVIGQLKGKCDRTILLAHMPYEQAQPLAKKLPECLFALCAHQGDEPDIKQTPDGLLLFAGTKSKYVIGIKTRPADGGKAAAIKAEEVELGPKLKDTKRITELLDFYQQVIRHEDLIGKVPKAPHPKGLYSGTQACAKCHPAAMKVWSNSGHSRAYETLVEQNRQYDPECVVCHVIGLKNVGGYRSMEATPQLANVGCEACHVPGKAHSDAPERYKTLQASRQWCVNCHDTDHDPKFDLGKAWPKIQHKKK